MLNIHGALPRLLTTSVNWSGSTYGRKPMHALSKLTSLLLMPFSDISEELNPMDHDFIERAKAERDKHVRKKALEEAIVALHKLVETSTDTAAIEGIELSIKR